MCTPAMLECLNSIPIEPTTVTAFFLTIPAVGFSVFAQIYSNLINNAGMTEVNVRFYALQANRASALASVTEAAICQKTAKSWLTESENLRSNARSRAYSTIWFALSLVFLLITFGVIFMIKQGWLIPFVISIILSIVAWATYFCNCKLKWLDRFGDSIHICPILPRERAVEDVIDQNKSWLQPNYDNVKKRY